MNVGGLAEIGARVRKLAGPSLGDERHNKRHADDDEHENGARDRGTIVAQRRLGVVRRLLVGFHLVELAHAVRGPIGEYAPHEADEQRRRRPAHVVRLRRGHVQLAVAFRLHTNRRRLWLVKMMACDFGVIVEACVMSTIHN